MIRHITFSSYFLNIKKDGFLKPDPEWQMNTIQNNHILFEKDWQGDTFFKVFFLKNNSIPGRSFSPVELMALIFDEHDLLIKGYNVDEVSESDTKYIKSMAEREEISKEEYQGIGELININTEIPLDYIKNIDIPDNIRLENIGLM